MFSFKIRRDDEVVVISGTFKGKKGKVLSVCKQKRTLVVKDVNVVRRHTKSSAKEAGGILKKESPIHISNVSLIDPKTHKPTRVGFKFNKGAKFRYSKSSGEIL